MSGFWWQGWGSGKRVMVVGNGLGGDFVCVVKELCKFIFCTCFAVSVEINLVYKTIKKADFMPVLSTPV